MKHEEAEQVFQLVATVYDLHPERAAEQAPVWVPMLERHDAELAMVIVDKFIEGHGPERFPKVGQFAEMLRGLEEKRRQADAPTTTIEPDELTKPLWVIAWDINREQHARDAEIPRLTFPEQEGGYRQLGLQWPPEGATMAEGDVYDELLALAAQRPVAKSERIVEREPDCPVCLDTAWVETGLRRFMYVGRIVNGSEQMAPCPACDLGKLIEHPIEATGPWGRDGFWRGQKWVPVRSGVVEAI